MWGALITAGSQLLGSYMSNKSAKDNAAAGNAATAASMKLYEGAANSLANLTPPNLSSMLEPLQRAVSMGELTPEQYVTMVQEQTALAGIQIPQNIIDAQYKALADMEQIANEGGLTAIDRAKLENIKGDLAAQEQGKRDAITQNAARRGLPGGGLEFMQKIANQQGAATRGSQMGFDVAAAAQKRALDSIVNSGTMAGNLRTQEYNQQSEEAKARDMINKFNTSAAQNTADKNTSAANDAAAANLATKYKLQEFNIGQQAKDSANRLAAAQDDWSNVFDQTKSVANIGTGQAAGLAKSGSELGKLGSAQQAAALQGLGNAAGSAYKAYEEYKKPKDEEAIN